MSQDTPFTPMHIGGQNKASSTGGTFEVRDPSTKELVSIVAAASAADCKEAVDNAGKAFESWQHSTPAFRAGIFRKAIELINTPAYQERIINFNVREAGLTKEWATFIDIGTSKAYLTQAVDMPYKVQGRILASDLGNQAFIYKRPMGVIFVMSPWNCPLGLTFATTLPALAAGNTVVLKTSEVSPACQLIAAELFKEAGLPDGVFNVIHVAKEDAGPRVAEIIAHPLVRKIAFTGSDRVARILATEAAKHLKPCVFELGGKSPAVVLNDADIDAAARGIVSGAMWNSGQSCISTERVIVQKDVAQKLVDGIKAAASQIKAGEGGKLGGLFSEASADNVISMVKEAVDGGADLLVGDLKREGNVVQPHVILGTKPGSRLWDRETFGPVVTIAVVDTVDDAVNMANATTYSLASSLWTNDARKAIDIGRRIRSCRVMVNQSTIGNEAGFHASAFGGSSGYGCFDVDTFLDEQLLSIPPPSTNRIFPLVDM